MDEGAGARRQGGDEGARPRKMRLREAEGRVVRIGGVLEISLVDIDEPVEEAVSPLHRLAREEIAFSRRLVALLPLPVAGDDAKVDGRAAEQAQQPLEVTPGPRIADVRKPVAIPDKACE